MEQRDSGLSVGCRVRMLAPASAWKEVVSLSRTFVQFEGQPPVGRRTLERLIASGQAEVEPQRAATVVEKDPGALEAGPFNRDIPLRRVARDLGPPMEAL